MSKKLYSTKKKWYDKELKTRNGEMIVLMDNDAFNIEYDEDNYEFIDKFWLNENPRLLFKPASNITSVFAEIFVSFFYNMFGLDTIQARPAVAVSNKQSGMLSIQGIMAEDFVKNRVKDKDIYSSEFVKMNYTRFHSVAENIVGLHHFAQKVRKRYKYSYKVEIDSTIKNSLAKLVLLDYLTHNADRHNQNISYLLIKQKDKILIKLAPIYDNGMSFELVGKNKRTLLKAIKENDAKTFEKMLNKTSTTRFTLTSKDYDYDEKMENYMHEVVNENIKTSLAKEIRKNTSLKFMFNKILKLNFDDVLQNIKEEMPEFKPNEDDILLAKYVFEFKRNLLVKELEKINENKIKNKAIKKDNKNENQCLF